jgi:hypothetical protein
MPPVSVSLDEVRTELRQAREELDAWAHSLASDAKKEKAGHEQAMAQARGAPCASPRRGARSLTPASRERSPRC